ncbi:hypothetical protein BRADI_1g59792v3 [Brachypodium distachyon]|uniref:Uncharacterized protein n=1 Tax=Brachypodium distachyon TaxID=15368 RepID=A0A2K2DSI1_BRADI|nr:hypothetical protein BRADI_1g59792v3 [Brachypodium distachyon]
MKTWVSDRLARFVPSFHSITSTAPRSHAAAILDLRPLSSCLSTTGLASAPICFSDVPPGHLPHALDRRHAFVGTDRRRPRSSTPAPPFLPPPPPRWSFAIPSGEHFHLPSPAPPRPPNPLGHTTPAQTPQIPLFHFHHARCRRLDL